MTVASITSGARAYYQDARKNLALRSLESELAKIIKASNAHRKNGVAPGAEVYGILLGKAEAALDKFCTTHKVLKSEIESQMPALTELRTLGTKTKPKNPLVMFFGSAVGLYVAILLAGLLSGFIQRVFHFGWAVAQFHLR